MTTAARQGVAITDEDRAAFDRLVKALPFDPVHPPEMKGESLTMYLARVFDLDDVMSAHAAGRRVDDAAAALDALAREAHHELTEQRRDAHLTAARSIADGKVPKADAKAVAALAAARDRADYLAAANIGRGPRLAAIEQAGEAMNAQPVTTAALILTLGVVLAAHEDVRRSVNLRPTREGVPTAVMVLRVVAGKAGGRSWAHGKSADDRRYLARVEHLARQWADAVVVPAIHDRMGIV